MTAETNGTCCGSGQGETESPESVGTGKVRAVYRVAGMTCGHCEGAVREELAAVAGVSAVDAVASTGLVTVTSAAPLDDATVQAAVDEAGYEFVGRG
ncbi:heavy-metal-associated domain-containing protein [Streptomyces meridianus]|uniref:Heavy-metal-associated domain-containing protein n=1 Tax=Streptomyces meridianus TaxID=2938945 RepID=A0ABT0X084_9ACTN|nr:heavy-metal-associated domain-containing protein [Streptomyces meridianus]MCM2575933.1 heavy-metal-associated domain-containing protein [Streptomyces meridianus]